MIVGVTMIIALISAITILIMISTYRQSQHIPMPGYHASLNYSNIQKDRIERQPAPLGLEFAIYR